MASSSGGIFSEISMEILNQGGVVYGATYDENFHVLHKCVESSQELATLRGAKYAQSDIGICLSDIQERLESGQIVLFSGTPCQVTGLKAFLKKDYDLLYCIDFVCHGVPSPMVWEEYVQYRADLDCHGLFPRFIDLRCKESGWSRYSYSVDFTYENGVRYLRKNGEDEFMQMFVKDYVLRESCGYCKEKGYDRESDITLGDFWGIWDINPEMDDNKGTSMILTHSEKGEYLLRKIKDRVQMKQVELKQASQMNTSMLKSSEHKRERKEILDAISNSGFQSLNILLPEHMNLKEAIANKARGLIKKVFNIGKNTLVKENQS